MLITLQKMKMILVKKPINDSVNVSDRASLEKEEFPVMLAG
jgi:hypothetical protein